MTLSEQLREMRENIKDITLWEAGMREGLLMAIREAEKFEQHEPSGEESTGPVGTVQTQDRGEQEEAAKQEAAKEVPAERAPSKRRADNKGAGAAEAQG
jgi:hypothetical protein